MEMKKLSSKIKSLDKEIKKSYDPKMTAQLKSQRAALKKQLTELRDKAQTKRIKEGNKNLPSRPTLTMKKKMKESDKPESKMTKEGVISLRQKFTKYKSDGGKIRDYVTWYKKGMPAP